MKFLLKATLPPKMAFFEENFDFLGQQMTFLKKIFETSQDLHKSEVKVSNKCFPPLKIFLNPYPFTKSFWSGSCMLRVDSPVTFVKSEKSDNTIVKLMSRSCILQVCMYPLKRLPKTG
jgi:hypothetical protein